MAQQQTVMGHGGSHVSRMAKELKKPAKDKDYNLTAHDDNVPLKLHGCTELRSSMERHRSGIWYCGDEVYTSPEAYGDRKFSPDDRSPVNGKPRDTGH